MVCASCCSATPRCSHLARGSNKVTPGFNVGMGHVLPYAVNCTFLFTEVELLQRPAAARAAGFEAMSSGGLGQISRSRPMPKSMRSSQPYATPGCN